MTQNNQEKPTDDELVRLAKEGDRSAFGQLIERHYRSTLTLASSILRNRAEAEDEAQNAWCKAIEHIGQFQGEAKFTTWMTRIVLNQCLMRLRQQRRMRLLYLEESGSVEDGPALELRDETMTIEQLMSRAEAAQVLMREISRIPPLLRRVMLLRDVNRLPMTVVAENLGISLAAAKSRLLRARVELRSRLTKHLGRSGPAAMIA